MARSLKSVMADTEKAKQASAYAEEWQVTFGAVPTMWTGSC